MRNLADDQSGFLDSLSKSYHLQPFSLERINYRIHSQDSIRFESIKSVDILKVLDTFSNCLVIFWNPHCPADINFPKQTESLRSSKLPVLLVSISNNLPFLDHRLKLSPVSAPVYLIVDHKYYSNKMLLKKLIFIRDVCNSCYNQYQGELINANAVLFRKVGPSEVFFQVDPYEIEYHINRASIR